MGHSHSVAPEPKYPCHVPAPTEFWVVMTELVKISWSCKWAYANLDLGFKPVTAALMDVGNPYLCPGCQRFVYLYASHYHGNHRCLHLTSIITLKETETQEMLNNFPPSLTAIK
jgi:hypothetical protein